MNLMIQPKQRRPLFLVALVLACFAFSLRTQAQFFGEPLFGERAENIEAPDKSSDVNRGDNAERQHG
jgi:hypothetical protein